MLIKTTFYFIYMHLVLTVFVFRALPRFLTGLTIGNTWELPSVCCPFSICDLDSVGTKINMGLIRQDLRATIPTRRSRSGDLSLTVVSPFSPSWSWCVRSGLSRTTISLSYSSDQHFLRELNDAVDFELGWSYFFFLFLSLLPTIMSG